jgi:hypothetical protein
MGGEHQIVRLGVPALLIASCGGAAAVSWHASVSDIPSFAFGSHVVVLEDELLARHEDVEDEALGEAVEVKERGRCRMSQRIFARWSRGCIENGMNALRRCPRSWRRNPSTRRPA